MTAISTNVSAANNFSVYPNPSNGEFTISFIENEAEISVLNFSGQVIIRSKAEKGKIKLKIDNNGIYLIHIRTLHGNSTQKIIVNH